VGTGTAGVGVVVVVVGRSVCKVRKHEGSCSYLRSLGKYCFGCDAG